MKKFIKFPSIEQFRTVVSNINRTTNFVGLDENGDAIYDLTLPKPKITFKGTIKLHGTNAGVCGNSSDGIWVQSRKNIITPESDNAGFAFFVESKKDTFNDMIDKVFSTNNLDTVENTVSIYGEWCGKGIQKGVGISEIDKSFFIFGVKITPHDESKPAYWVDYTYLRDESNNIYNINDYETYEVVVDFNEPKLVQNNLNELTLSVEEECPVAKAFGLSVWENNTAYEDEVGNIWFENESFPNFTNPIKDKLKAIFKEKRVKNPNGINFIKFSLM